MLLDDKWCKNCGGPCTRSEQYAAPQPKDSPLCAPCWYNIAHPTAPLLSTGDLDDFKPEEWGDHLIGRLVDWHSEIAPLVKIANGGVYVQVHLTCRCGKLSETLYASSGLHHGAWCYICDESGHYLANIRDQEYNCGHQVGTT